MYAQITTYCNMTCAHCCFSCEKGKKGEHMTRRIFNQALALSAKFGEYFCIGGGEPTMHPKFWDFFGMAMGSNCEGIWMATNGSITKSALALANLSGDGKFSCALSQDIYHDPIDKEVLFAFEESCAEIRNVTGNVINTGAAMINQVADRFDDCACNEIHVKPDGNIYVCGCDDSPHVGNVADIDEGVYSRACEMLSERGCGHKLDNEDKAYIFKNIERGDS